jgi:hypothetical protein
MTRRSALRTRSLGFLLVNAAFVLAMAAVGLWAAWPVYETPLLFVTVGGAVVVAVAIAFVAMLRSWSWFTVVYLTMGAYLLFGVPLAVPSALSSVSAALTGFVDLLTATVFSWKELTTISLPVGSYQTLLVPAFIVFLAGLTAALSLAWRSPALGILVVPIMFCVQVFGLAFGSSAVSESIELAGVSFPAPRETIIGVVAFVLAIGYLVWRTQHARSAALRRSTQATGVRRAASSLPRTLKRVGLASLVLLVAVAVALPVIATVARPTSRDVLRTAIERPIDLREYVSPLAQYRNSFTADGFNAELFTVTSEDALPSRVRLAVLSHYDGEVFRAIDPELGASSPTTAFERVPNQSAQRTGTSTVEFTIGAYGDVWLPLVDDVESISFSGSRAQALTDGFFYNSLSGAGVELGTVGEGDSYRVTSGTDETTASLDSLSKPGSLDGLVDEAVMPEKLVEWVRLQDVGTDGAALADLIDRLRDRGYLSHSLAQPIGTSGTWVDALDPYVFEPSLAGHSVDRLDALFATLIDKQKTAIDQTDSSQLIAGVGDDEQFAVAAALIAQHLGYPSRVVLGFSLGEVEGGIPACEAGVCEGKNLTAWIEVQDSSGAWVSLDTTPQFASPISPRDDERRDPENDTVVVQEGVSEQLPPNSNPTGGEANEPDDTDDTDTFAALFAVLRIVGISLLLVLLLTSPILVILGAKLKRRRDRKRAADATARIAGGWEEFVDAAVDHGHPWPGARTRVEAALEYGNDAPRLATLADEAVFGPVEPDAAMSAEFWALVDAQRTMLARGTTRWRRIRAALSVRSFARLTGARRAESKR